MLDSESSYSDYIYVCKCRQVACELGCDPHETYKFSINCQGKKSETNFDILINNIHPFVSMMHHNFRIN